MSDMHVFYHFLFASISTLGFCVFLNAPLKTLVPAGLSGGIGWAIFVYLYRLTGNSIISNFIGALVVSLLGEILARKIKQPAIVFVVPGIIPLVPGLGMYNTMLYLVQSNYDLAISTGADVLFVGGAISMGVMVMTSLSRTFNAINERFFKNKSF